MNIARMNKAELAAEARAQGKQINDDMTREDLISLINDGGRPAEDVMVSPDALSGKTKKVIIASKEGPGGSDAVPLGLQGKVWSVPRDKAVDLPIELCEVLENAVATHFEQDGKDSDGNIKWKERHVPRFNFQYVH